MAVADRADRIAIGNMRNLPLIRRKARFGASVSAFETARRDKVRHERPRTGELAIAHKAIARDEEKRLPAPRAAPTNTFDRAGRIMTGRAAGAGLARVAVIRALVRSFWRDRLRRSTRRPWRVDRNLQVSRVAVR
jgi:hypothetical protein